MKLCPDNALCVPSNHVKIEDPKGNNANTFAEFCLYKKQNLPPIEHRNGAKVCIMFCKIQTVFFAHTIQCAYSSAIHLLI